MFFFIQTLGKYIHTNGTYIKGIPPRSNKTTINDEEIYL